MDELLDLFLTLCHINSPSRSERAVQDFLAEELRALGLQPIEDDAAAAASGNAGNLIVEVPATVTGAPTILLTAHVDTVEPNPDVPIVVEGGIVRTDGSAILGADDKAGVAPLLYALKKVRREGLPHGPLWVAFTVCEEVGLLGAKALDIEAMGAEMAFVLDAGPPVGTYIAQAPWLTELHGEVIGRAAHAGVRPEDGISAIEVAADAIAGMKLGRLDEETTANVGVLKGGQATNVVCPRVEFSAEARSLSKTKLDAQIAHMRSCFEAAAQRRGATAVVCEHASFEGYARTPGERVVDVAQSAARSLGMSGALRKAGGGSDANVLNARGLPSVVVCTGMQKNHTHEEFCSISDLHATADLTLALLGLVAVG
ncbi:MAG: M20/M25/M40 family metallo-hydrolase [Fimbriimonadia bacterium]|jgi:tripeptide aminopeptidase